MKERTQLAIAILLFGAMVMGCIYVAGQRMMARDCITATPQYALELGCPERSVR